MCVCVRVCVCVGSRDAIGNSEEVFVKFGTQGSANTLLLCFYKKIFLDYLMG